MVRENGARRGLRHNSRAGKGKERRKGIQRAVEKVAGDERAFIPSRAAGCRLAGSDAILDAADGEGGLRAATPDW